MTKDEAKEKIKETISNMPELGKAWDSFSAKAKKEFGGLKEEIKYYHDNYSCQMTAALTVLFFCVAMILHGVILISKAGEAYVAGNTGKVGTVLINKQDLVQGADPATLQGAETYEITRKKKKKTYREKLKTGDVTYVRIKDEAAPLKSALCMTRRGSEWPRPFPDHQYIREDCLSDDINDVVRETEVYVRTPVTIYAEKEGPAIASFAPKGSCLKVAGYDVMNDDGSVNKYKVEYTYDDGEIAEGYVYGKYVTDTQEKADAVYNGDGIYDKVSKDNYDMKLYGGKAANLDYYPYKRTEIEGNEFCRNARTMYLNCAAGTHPKNYIKLINDTDCNAVVVDIKDGVLAYKSEVAKEMSPRSYKTAYASVEDYKAGIDALRESGVYLIGRIVVFNDPIYAKDHPEHCIIWGKNTGWPSAYSREVWEYNVRLAQEAVKEFGFNEIQFDYVRFPENSYEMSKSGVAKFHNDYDEEKGQAVQNFCFYAADQIHEAGAYFSVDVFGESAYGYMTAYGQYWPGISNIVDAISAMPYTDHMGGEGSWNVPYDTMKNWAKRAAKRQAYLKDPAVARTWITGYDTPHWAPEVNYGNKQLKAQVKALEEQGLDGGFIPWNAASSLEKYYQYKDVWNK